MDKKDKPAEEKEPRYSGIDIERLESEVQELKEQLAVMQAALETITKIVVGNGGINLRTILADIQSKLANVVEILQSDKNEEIIADVRDTLKELGGLFETLRHQVQQQERRLDERHAETASTQKEITQMWQDLVHVCMTLLKAQQNVARA